MDSAWFNDVDSCRISRATFRGSENPVANRQRNSGVSSGSLTESVSTVAAKPAHQVTLGEYKKDFRGQVVAKGTDKLYDIAKEFDKLRIPGQNGRHGKSHSTKEVEHRRIATTDISSPGELPTDIPILSSAVNNNNNNDCDDRQNPTTVAHQSRSKPTRTRKTPNSHTASNDSGLSSGSSCHSGKSCKHYTYIYHQYGHTPPPQYDPVHQPVPPPLQYYTEPPAKAHFPWQKATEFVYEEAVSRPRRKRSSTRHRPQSPTFEESLIAAISPRFADSMPFFKSKPIPVPDRVMPSDIVKLVKHNRYWFLADIIKGTITRANLEVGNYVAELQNVLQQYVKSLDRDIRRYRNDPEFLDFVSERQEERAVCWEKVDELQKICLRDARSSQKLPVDRYGSGPTAEDLNYQFRLIYGCFSY
uniref:CLIP1_ZNF domain-containing protein n=1 Tax=Panagrellus redivivus TaxID=6233 RepID=A0A7E4VL67_PANRE